MRITFLVSGSISSNFSYRPLALARSLHALGHDVSVIAPKADKYNNFIAENITDIDGVRILQPFQFTTKRLEINLLPYLFGATRLLIEENPDLVYIYKPTPISIVGLLGTLFRGTPTVTDFDDLGSEVMRIEGHPMYQRKLVEWSEKLAAQYADSIVVASTYLHDMYHAEFPTKPIRIIPNGVESDWLDAPTPSEKSKRIVFMGSVNRKNILEPLFDALPHIISKYPETELLLIGDGKFLPYFKEKAEALDISKNITFTGWLPIKIAKTYLRAGDIGYNYMPDEITTRAASNMKVPQYMSRGVVPLVSDVGDLSATVDFGKAGYICKDTLGSLSETLLYALQDPSRWQKSVEAKSYTEKELDWQHLAAGFDQWMWPKKSGKKKIYVVATTVPGNVGGGEIRNINLIKQLIKQADVEVFCISPNNIEIERRNFESYVSARCHIVPNSSRSFFTMMRAILLRRVPPYMDDFKSSDLGKVFRATCEASLPDVVHIEQLHAYYCIREHIMWLKNKGVKIVFSCHNIEFQSFKDSLNIFPASKKLIGLYLTPHLKQLEIEAAKRSDVVIACSKHDANFFGMYNPRTHIIPNGVDCSEFEIVSRNEKPILIFMGGVGYPPNADAMQFYLTDIHPKIKKDIPDIELLAIGTDKKWLDNLGLNDPSIKPLGFVDDVRPYLHQATVGICPVRHGGGTRIKIMTYMAAGLPVVSMKKGAEGVPYENGSDIIITDDPAEFSNAIIRLLTDPIYWNKISRNGHGFILNNYDWDILGKKLLDIYQHDLA